LISAALQKISTHVELGHSRTANGVALNAFHRAGVVGFIDWLDVTILLAEMA